ncbi:MAG: hypothetical protein ACRD2G_00610, partial [Terriglobia bacterium]
MVLGAMALIAVVAPRCFSAPETAFVAGRVFDNNTGQVIPCTVTIRASHDKAGSKPQDFTFRSAGQFDQAVPPGAVT